MQIKKLIMPSMVSGYILLLTLLTVGPAGTRGQAAQEPVFELPVQLVGFPVIILAVRLSNFVKKLSYSLSPQTYVARSRRSAEWNRDDNGPHSPFAISREAIDISIAEKQILSELGPKACVLEEPCRIHAARPGRSGEQPDWNDILQNYKVQSNGMKQWYLLSVFLGDLMRDVPLCKKLAKRLQCGRDIRPFVRD